MGAQLEKGLPRIKTLFAFGINHKTAPVEIRERLHLGDDEIPSFLMLLKESLAEVVVLSTCNRTEIYGVSDSRDIDIEYFQDLLVRFKSAGDIVNRGHFFALISCTATQQIFNVATSIDSRVIGDSQILRQLRAAYDTARRHGCTGKILNQLMQRAFKLGKMTYTATSIHDGAVSVSLAAVELSVETFGSLRDRTAIVVGAGEMARCTAEALVNKRVKKILVANRTRGNAEELVASLDLGDGTECEVIDFDDLRNNLCRADIIVSSTGSAEPILYPEDFGSQRRKTIVIDIAVPRDIDTAVGEIPGIVLQNIDDLRSVIDGHQERRQNDIPKVRKMVIDAMAEFLVWYYSLPLMPDYERTGTKPPAQITYEILQVKRFLDQNLSEIHRLAATAGGDFYEDLNNHFSLISRLRTLKAHTEASTPV